MFSDVTISSLLVFVFGGGGLIAGITALLKYRKETDSIIVTSAETTVRTQALVLESLSSEVIRLTGVIKELNEKLILQEAQIAKLIAEARDEVIKQMPH